MKKIKKKTGLPRRLCLLLLAVLFLFGTVDVGIVAEADEKSLSVKPGHYVAWRKGLPPQDGKWYRVLIIGSRQFSDILVHGNEYEGVWINGAGDTGGDELIMDDPKDEVKYFPEIDLSRDSFFTGSYLMSLAMRYNRTAGSAGNGKEPHFGNAPYYEIALPKTDTTVDSIGFRYDPANQYDTTGEPLDYSAKITGNPTPWFFCGYEHDDSVDRGKYVIGCLQNMNNRGTNLYFALGGSYRFSTAHEKVYEFLCMKMMWFETDEFIIYYGEEMMVDAITDNQVIGDDEIVNVKGNSYLTLQAGNTLTVKDGGILSIGSGLFNDGTIRVEKGGTLIIEENAFLMPWQPGSGNGNIVCAGGDVIIRSGGRVVCEGASGFKFVEEGGTCGTVYNYGVIVTQALTIRGKANAFHNEGGVMLGFRVQPSEAQSFRDGAVVAYGPGVLIVSGMVTTGINVDQVTDSVVTGNEVWRS